MDERRGIGKDGDLPWHLPSDLKRFKQLTMGHHLIMGRHTYQSIGRLLPGRIMIVVSRQQDYQAPGCLVAHSLEQALALAQNRGEIEVFVIGGGELFAEAINLADRIYLTEVQTVVECDTFFPDFMQNAWVEVDSSYHKADENNPYASHFRILERAS
jgi:dihydrofolate reductase